MEVCHQGGTGRRRPRGGVLIAGQSRRAVRELVRAADRSFGRRWGLHAFDVGRQFADQYEQVFEVRSAFLHGRAMTAISTKERVLARSLARQVVEALILATRVGPILSREDFLDGLLDKGAQLI